MIESCLSFKLKSSAELSTCLCMKCLWKNICGKEGKNGGENWCQLLLLLESSLEKSEGDGADWASWGKMSSPSISWFEAPGAGSGRSPPAWTEASRGPAARLSRTLGGAELCRNCNSLQVWADPLFLTSSVTQEEPKWAVLLLDVWNPVCPQTALVWKQDEVEAKQLCPNSWVLIFLQAVSGSQLSAAPCGQSWNICSFFELEKSKIKKEFLTFFLWLKLWKMHHNIQNRLHCLIIHLSATSG